MKIKTIRDIDVNNKIVILRVDYNVPVIDNKITDDKRIVATLETIKYLYENNAKILILSHRGRPKGERNEKYSLKIVKYVLQKKLGKEVSFFDDILADNIKEEIEKLPFPSITLFENIRFYKQEKKGEEGFAKHIADLGDVYVNDGFAVCHRKHASVYQIPHLMKEKAMGFLIEKEVEHLSSLINNPKKPYIFIIGGAKVSTKLDVLKNTLNYASTIIIGGGLAFTFLKSQGFEIGKSLFEEEMLDECEEIFKIAEKKNVNILLPVDIIVSKTLEGENIRTVQRNQMETDDLGLDIGPMSIEIFKGAVNTAQTIVWNGPMGYFENDNFIKGTEEIAKAVAEKTKNGAYSVIGGGDSSAALHKLHLENDVSFVSTGGGAMLEYLSGIELPGLNALKEEK